MLKKHHCTFARSKGVTRTSACVSFCEYTLRKEALEVITVMKLYIGTSMDCVDLSHSLTHTLISHTPSVCANPLSERCPA